MPSPQSHDISRFDDNEYTPLLGVLPLWDMSFHAGANVLSYKIGKAVKVRGGAVVGRLDPAGRSQWADGLTNETKKNTIFPLDPDNWVPRVYGGDISSDEGDIGVWSFRVVADGTHKADRRGNRSTQVVDGDGSQSWAWMSSYLRVVEPNGGTPTLDKSLWYDHAGFLPGLYEQDETEPKFRRGELAATVFRNQGFTTDGGHVGQWSHLFTFPSPAPAPVASPSGASNPGGGQLRPTIAEDREVVEPPISPSAGARATKGAEQLLRGDAKIRFTDGIGRFVSEKLPKTPPESGEARLVHVTCLAELAATEDVTLDPATDTTTNTVKIPKDAQARKIVGYVKVPAHGSSDSPRYDYSGHSPPPPPPPGSDSGSDVATGGGSTPPSTGENPDTSDATEGDYDTSDGFPPEGVDTESPSAETGAPTTGAEHGFIDKEWIENVEELHNSFNLIRK